MRRDAGTNRTTLANIDTLANHAQWGSFTPGVQNHFLDALSRSPADTAHAGALREFADSAEFRRLTAPVQSTALQRWSGTNDANTRASIGALARSPTLGHLGAPDQTRMLELVGTGDQNTRGAYRALINGQDYQRSTPEQRAGLMRTFMQGRRTPAEASEQITTRLGQMGRDTPGLRDHLTRLGDDAQFRALSPELQGQVLDRLGGLTADADRRNFLNLATNAGFGRLNAGEQSHLVDYAGGNNTIIAPGARHAISSMMGSAGFRDANADQQAAWLRELVRDQPGSRALPNRETDPQRAEYRLTPVDGTPGHYRVRIDGRDIPIQTPTNVNDARQLIGNDGRPIQIDGRPAYVHTPDQVARALAAMPPELRAMVNSVRLSAERNAQDAQWNRTYGQDRQEAGRPAEAANYNDWAARYREELRGPRSPFRSYATAGQAGDITFYPTRWDTGAHQAYIDSTIMHEAGHTYSARNFPRFEDWDRARAADRVVPSNYARNASTEDFSEMLSLYYVARGTPQEAEMRRLMPARFEIIDRLFPRWTDTRR